MITKLSMLRQMSFSMYTIKQSFIHWSFIWLCHQFFATFIAENAFSTMAVTIGKVNVKLTNSKLMDIPHFFSLIHFLSQITNPSLFRKLNTTAYIKKNINIKLIIMYHEFQLRKIFWIKLNKENQFLLVESSKRLKNLGIYCFCDFIFELIFVYMILFE